MKPQTDRIAFKGVLYGQFARIGKALASPHRLELLELLAQGERTVEALATEASLPVANASSHLQVLKDAGLIEGRKNGLYVHYRLAEPAVFDLCRALRGIAERRLADVERVVRSYVGDRSGLEPVGVNELLSRLRSGQVVVIDARPALEYAAGHIPGALSIPVSELKRRVKRLPKRKEFVAYCRGPYCVFADQAIEVLKSHGRRARRLTEGFPEWRAAGLPVETGASQEPRP